MILFVSCVTLIESCKHQAHTDSVATKKENVVFKLLLFSIEWCAYWAPSCSLISRERYITEQWSWFFKLVASP